MGHEPLRWGISSTGHIATRFMNGMTLVDDGVVDAVGSRTSERAEAFAREHGIARPYGSADELAADPEIDIVYVASTQNAHARDAIGYLEAGKHVLCEKPFALNAAGAASMVAAARRNGVFLMEAIWSRFLPAYGELRRLLDDGRIGTPLVVDADLGFSFSHNPTHRLFDLELGGGALLDVGIYPLQLCSFVFGPCDQVVGVGHLGSTGVDERTAAVLHHADGGLGVIKAAITAPMGATARITGSDGWIELPALMHDPRHLTVVTPAGTEVIETPYEGEGLRFQVHEVHRCIREGLTESPRMTLGETLRLAETMDEIRRQIGLRYPGETDDAPA